MSLALFCWFWIPETRGIPLEEIDTVGADSLCYSLPLGQGADVGLVQLFGGTDHRAEGQKIHEANEARADGLLRDIQHDGMETPTLDAEKSSEHRVENVVEARRETV